MLDHPASTHPVGALTDVRRDSGPNPFDLTVDRLGYVHFAIRAAICTLIVFSAPLGMGATTATSKVAVGWDRFTLVSS
jgi:hypothetical protein